MRNNGGRAERSKQRGERSNKEETENGIYLSFLGRF
jgi:hypothetical protein